MSAKEVGVYISEKFPMVVRSGKYKPPDYRCSRWVLINGPIYGDGHIRGTFLVDASKIVDWMRNHAEKVYSSVQTEQEAREFLPDWFLHCDIKDESVTLLDNEQKAVLQGHTLKFVWSDWCKVWCPDCHKFYGRIKEHDEGWARIGRVTIRYDDLHCVSGHLLQKDTEREPIRWIF